MQFISKHTDDRFFLIDNVNISVRGEPDLEEGDVFRLTVPLINNSSENSAIGNDNPAVDGKNLAIETEKLAIDGKNSVIEDGKLVIGNENPAIKVNEKIIKK